MHRSYVKTNKPSLVKDDTCLMDQTFSIDYSKGILMMVVPFLSDLVSAPNILLYMKNRQFTVNSESKDLKFTNINI